ncbi:MAG TPA: nucleotidyltransferase family protein, partial [Thermoanaerobaculia bacterium]|nr:nucleotidyltransferase family protein [Thermoanaerobaculia bacterium]
MPLELSLYLEARRRREEPAFGVLSRAMARCLEEGRLESLAPALGTCRDPVGDALFCSRVQGVSGLLAALGEREGTGLSNAVLEGFRDERRRIGLRGEKLMQDVADLGALASRQGLPFVPLKGAILASERYRDPSLRPCADIDLLAPDAASFEAWSRALAEAGYRLQTEDEKDRVFLRPGAHVPDSFAEHPDNPRPVELHRRLTTRLLGRTVDLTDRYLASLSDGRLLGVPARLPTENALALHLFVHAGPDLVGRGCRLLQLYDFTTLHPDPAFADDARALLGEAAWGLGSLIEKGSPNTLPRGVVERLETFAPSERRRRVWRARPGLLTGDEERTFLFLAE